jgi:hypothetical protein
MVAEREIRQLQGRPLGPPILSLCVSFHRTPEKRGAFKLILLVDTRGCVWPMGCFLCGGAHSLVVPGPQKTQRGVAGQVWGVWG